MSEPIRLAKRVAALRGCSRADAERYVEDGWVSVDGVVIDRPQHKVTTEVVTIAADASLAPPEPATLLLHKPPGFDAISGSNPPWKPLRAFDDGEKVYIQFPPGIAQGELPPLFVIGAQGDGQLVNYRFRSPYYIVDRLFGGRPTSRWSLRPRSRCGSRPWATRRGSVSSIVASIRSRGRAPRGTVSRTGRC